MLVCDLEVLEHALSDGDAWDDNDKLLKPVRLVELVNRAEVDVRLSGSSLHLDRKVHSLQVLGFLYLVPRLDFLHVLHDFLLRQPDGVSDTILGESKARVPLLKSKFVVARVERLSLKHIHD